MHQQTKGLSTTKNSKFSNPPNNTPCDRSVTMQTYESSKSIKQIIVDFLIAIIISIVAAACFCLLSKYLSPKYPDAENSWNRNLAIVVSYLAVLIFFAVLLFRHKNSLLLSIVIWVLLGVGCYTVLSSLWGGYFLAGWIGKKSLELSFKELLSATLTAVGGIGAVGYLVIKYREQASSEREEVHQSEGEANKKLAEAVQQLGSKPPQVRIAGIYALADVAETYGGFYHQRVIDILCGYLRTKRTGRMHNSKGWVPRNIEKPAESTIFAVLGRLLGSTFRTNSSSSTQHREIVCDVDLHDAHLVEEINMEGASIRNFNLNNGRTFNIIQFVDTFFEDTDLNDTHFKTDARFIACKFWGKFQAKGMIAEKAVTFQKCVFRYEPDFSGANFQGRANFIAAKFEGPVNFSTVHFSETPKFDQATFNLAYKSLVSFPKSIVTDTGLPAGAKWEEFPLHGTKNSLKIGFDYNPARRRRQIIILSLLNASEMNATDLSELIKSTRFCSLKRKKHFYKRYLLPLIQKELINEVMANSADSQQRYRITDQGRIYLHNTLGDSELASERESDTSEQRQPEEVPPVDSLPQDEGGEEDGDQDAQLVDGDHHAGRAILEGPVVAEPGGTRRSPGGEDEAELTTRHSTDLPELPCDSDHHPGHHQDHPGADRGTEVRLHSRNASFTEDRGEHSEDE